jgi:hypothetical protein
MAQAAASAAPEASEAGTPIWIWGLVGTAAAVVLVIGGLLILGGGEDEPDRSPSVVQDGKQAPSGDGMTMARTSARPAPWQTDWSQFQARFQEQGARAAEAGTAVRWEATFLGLDGRSVRFDLALASSDGARLPVRFISADPAEWQGVAAGSRVRFFAAKADQQPMGGAADVPPPIGMPEELVFEDVTLLAVAEQDVDLVGAGGPAAGPGQSELAEEPTLPPSETSATTKRSWGPEQAEGEPDTPAAGDRETAWASASPDGQEEWLICHYETSQQPSEIVVHETYNPGAVVKITVFDKAVQETLAWDGMDPTPRDQPMGVSTFRVRLETPTNKIKVYIDSQSVEGWNEIDAVGLRDAAGQTQWANHVEASTTYASDQPVATASGPPDASTDDATAIAAFAGRWVADAPPPPSGGPFGGPPPDLKLVLKLDAEGKGTYGPTSATRPGPPPPPAHVERRGDTFYLIQAFNEAELRAGEDGESLVLVDRSMSLPMLTFRREGDEPEPEPRPVELADFAGEWSCVADSRYRYVLVLAADGQGTHQWFNAEGEQLGITATVHVEQKGSAFELVSGTSSRELRLSADRQSFDLASADTVPGRGKTQTYFKEGAEAQVSDLADLTGRWEGTTELASGTEKLVLHMVLTIAADGSGTMESDIEIPPSLAALGAPGIVDQEIPPIPVQVRNAANGYEIDQGNATSSLRLSADGQMLTIVDENPQPGAPGTIVLTRQPDTGEGAMSPGPAAAGGAAGLTKADFNGNWKGVRGDGSAIQGGIRQGRGVLSAASTDGKRQLLRLTITDRDGTFVAETAGAGPYVNGAFQKRTYIMSLSEDRQSLTLDGNDEQGVPETLVLAKQ